LGEVANELFPRHATGLAAGLLLKALQNGRRGTFIQAQNLFGEMCASLADSGEARPPRMAGVRRSTRVFGGPPGRDDGRRPLEYDHGHSEGATDPVDPGPAG
jgi:hypothetical protein